MQFTSCPHYAAVIWCTQSLEVIPDGRVMWVDVGAAGMQMRR